MIQGRGRVPRDSRDQAFLFTDEWDDWASYRTQFSLHVADETGKIHIVGAVKIATQGLLPASRVSADHRAPVLPETFNKLSRKFFSLGQGEDYYETLNKLDVKLKARVLEGLRDCAFDLKIFEKNLEEEVMDKSLLRGIQVKNVRGRLNRLAHGDARLTKFKFNYTLPVSENIPPARMTFEVVPESDPPTNVHVLIGRNGVGKTQCMRQLALALLGRMTDDEKSPGTIEQEETDLEGWSFAGVVLISFSAFDDFSLNPVASDNVDCSQVGLRDRKDDDQRDSVKTFSELGSDFAASLERCRGDAKAERWRDAVRRLEVDDLFAEADVLSLLELPFDEEWETHARKLFLRLSSGHAIVLLTVTRLVELVDERTLVLLDEPEGHLHPPLLSAFIRCLSDLLVRRNGVAIIATHSPVVLQEVPRSCAWKLRRSRAVSIVERPTVETFGENIGMLTREVFGLQVTQSGFHELLRNAVSSELSYSQIVNKFDGQLGGEARAIIQALITERDEEL